MISKQLCFFSMVFYILSMSYGFAKNPLTKSRLTKLSGEDVLPIDHKSTWDHRYNKKHYIYGKRPAQFLAENFDFIKPGSLVLDMGMGEGRNAVFLAQKGHKVTGIDISSVAIKKANLLAREKNVKIKTVVGTLNKYIIKPNSFDVIICFYFVSRELNQKMLSWLKPGGIIIYEAHTLNEYSKFKRVPAKLREEKEYYLRPQELLSMFSNLEILKFEEPTHEKVFRSSIIARKKHL